MPSPPETPADDAVIARALRRSLGLLVVLAAVAGGLVFGLTRRPAQAPTRLTALHAPQPARADVKLPVVQFTDVTATAGITFHHENGGTGQKLLPETMGGGVAWFDFDGDGDPDLLFVNSTWWPGDQRRTAGPLPTLALYRNDTVRGGEPKFTDVTAGSGLDVSLYGMGVACGDFDNDGRVDVFVTAVGGNHLFHNLGGGKFADVTVAAGVGGGTDEWSTAATWVDIDNDGDLDLFVANYVRWSPDLDREVNNTLVGIGRAYGRPWTFGGTLPHLYRNEGGGRFTDISAASGLQVRNPATGMPMAKTLAVAPIDLNNDGFMDLVVANDTVQNFVFTNRHDGTFAEVGAATGLAFDPYGQARGAMGIDAARFRNDEALGIAIGNFANEMNALYVSRAAPREQLLFTDEAITEGLGPASRQLLKFGLFFFDYDLDGRLDVLTADGHLEEEIGKVQQGVHYRQPAQLFWNAGGKEGPTFVPADATNAGPDLFRPLVGRGSAYADFDGDGDLDVVITQINGPPVLFRNDQQLGHHWLRFKLVGTRSNRDAIGAWVTVRLNGQTLARQVMPTRSYLSQSELPVTFGLGDATRVDDITIVWPGGRTQKVASAKLDTLTEIREP
ncbi:MAG TPA: CRTAC1 family protein [Candidatus Limnocylindria bacterium]|jgi:hypothetical protein|nr:CRTAC1 family protein [Candidatus Limnocylindria bacterium]